MPAHTCPLGHPEPNSREHSCGREGVVEGQVLVFFLTYKKKKKKKKNTVIGNQTVGRR